MTNVGEEEITVLWMLATILLLLWIIGLLTSFTLNGYIHILLAVALILFAIKFLQRKMHKSV